MAAWYDEFLNGHTDVRRVRAGGFKVWMKMKKSPKGTGA
jgi:hypothetical protein